MTRHPSISEQPRIGDPNCLLSGTFCWSNCGSRQNPILGGSDPTGKYVTVVWAATYTGGEGDEDISSDGGDNWSEPIKVNEKPNKSRQWQAAGP